MMDLGNVCAIFHTGEKRQTLTKDRYITIPQNGYEVILTSKESVLEWCKSHDVCVYDMITSINCNQFIALPLKPLQVAQM